MRRRSLESRPRKLDAVDKRILAVLQQEARISNIELARRIGLSPSACLQRTKAMEKAGYILKYVMAVDLDRVCVNVKVYAEFTLASHQRRDLAKFEKLIDSIPEFIACWRVNGRVDYIALAVCSSIADFNSLSNDLLARNSGIVRVDSSTVLDAPKWFGGYALSALEWKA
jgi:Lrp/AsnC family leucine-responsive transcriptional regulator